MSWTAPMTAVANTAFTAAQWNTHGRDNLNVTAPGVATTAGGWIVSAGLNTVVQRTPMVHYVGTGGGTDQTSYVDLTSTGATLTVTTGPSAIVSFGAQMSNNVAGLGSRVAVDVTGASTLEASDLNSFYAESGNANDAFKGTWTTIFSPLVPGVNVFTLKYRTTTGGGTSQFSSRVLTVISF
ncbi:MAG: hypothetical protein ABIS86_17065 [Streptosporangiaceae bacterium]